MGRRSKEKRKTEIEQKMDRLMLIEKIVNMKIKIAKKLQRKQGISIKPDNIGQIAREKIEEEIIPQFQSAGINLVTDNSIMKDVIKQIIDDIIEQSKRGEDLLTEHNRILMPDTRNMQEPDLDRKQLQLRRTNPFERMIASIREFFSRNQKDIGEQDIEHANNNIKLYGEECETLANYNLRDNIVDTIVNKICTEGDFIQLGLGVPSLINRKIAPALKNMGLGDLIPELQKKLDQRYEKVEGGRCGNSEELRHIFIPHFEGQIPAESNGFEPDDD